MDGLSRWTIRQKLSSFSSRLFCSFPAIMAALMAPMEVPITQSGSIFDLFSA